MKRGLIGGLAALVVLISASVGLAQRCEFPGILLVVDRSVSMYTGRIDGARKWDIARDATAGILAQHGGAAHFGLMVYPGPSGSGANGVQGAVGACDFNRVDAGCAPLTPRCTTGEVVVDIGANTEAPINQALAWPDGLRHSYTPTWQSLEAASRYRGLQQRGRRNFVILITDGYQCCGLIDDNGALSCTPEDANLIPQKVGQLTDAGVTTFVVGFGAQTDARTLHRAAVRAGTLRPGCNPNTDNPAAGEVCYYQASQRDELEAFLDDIVRQIAEEVCDGQDNDCDGGLDEDLSRPCNGACGPGEEICFQGAWRDCSSPDAEPEVCNGRDDDCDGRADEDLRRNCATACGQGSEVCRGGDWEDCDAPRAEPEACNGDDDDCDGVVDEGCDCQAGDVRDCGDNRGRCTPGRQRCLPDGTWGACDGAVGPEPEICNGVDDDCDGIVDGMARGCNTACGPGEETCVEGRWQGCDAPDVIAEDCNGLDEDCDGRIDENAQRECFTACGEGIQQCRAGQWTDCSAREPEPEICDNGRDDDCNNAVDEGCACSEGETQPCGTGDGLCEAGVQTCRNNQWGPCEGEVTPLAESCNGYDDDCDGVTDEGDLCGPDEACGCARCSAPCENGECPGQGVCVAGFCIEDNCPEGLMCDIATGNCLPDDNGGLGGGDGRPDGGVFGDDGGTVTGSAASDDCNCATGAGGNPWTLLLLGLGLLGLRRRR